jgi:hypothetical protein
MKKFKIDCPYVISSFSNHKEIKQQLLNLIDTADFESVKFENVETDISKTDWQLAQEINREWLQLILNPLVDHMKTVYSHMGYDSLLIKDVWFQQYLNKSEHGWHVHSSNFTNIYYLEMPEGTPKTQIINPFNQTDIIELDVNEGDIVTFPSFIIHRAPKNISNFRKTIISFNADVNHPEESYTKNLTYSKEE